jgi:murein DD-endopeptidase MepM/ murein hydrolase activator NlpD/beta-lactamase regulating signal transducer with metallopeptidase domain
MLTALSGSPLIQALGLTLLHFLWQGALLAGALYLVLAALSRATPAARYGAACAALGAMALSPVGTFWVLSTHLPEAAASDPAVVATAPASGGEILLVVAGVWLAGTAVMTARLLGGLVHVTAIVKRHTEELGDDWQDRLARLGVRLGVLRQVRLAASARVDAPLVVGWLRPMVLVPLSILTSLPEDQLEAILAHELAHVRRHDYLVNIVQSAVEAALFYHPCVHWVSRRIRVEREYCCDDAVVALLADPFGYARALARLETLRAEPPSMALASTGGSLLLRVRRLVTPGPSRASSGSAWLAPALLLTMAVAVFGTGLAACGNAGGAPSTADTVAETPEKSVDIPWLPPSLQPYKPAFVAAAARHGVDPDALAIVALVESSGNAGARSSSGAVGLMQIMPATATRIAQERGLGDDPPAALLDPAHNVDVGGYYFAQQLAAFGSKADPLRSVELAAAAYNAGPRRVHAYLDRQEPLPEETEHYKTLVAGLWNERGAPRSATYEAWRRRVRARTAESTASPLPGARVTLPFGEQRMPQTGEPYFHQGIDLAGAEGTLIAAPLGGTVKSAAAEGDHGNVVVVDHGNGIETRFEHLGALLVTPGQTIARGAVLGAVGATGRVTGPHVHFEVRDNGEAVDPADYLGASPGPR